MKSSLLLLALLVISCALCNGQSISADHIQRQGPVVSYQGNVEIATDALVLHADEARYHAASGEVELRGNIRVKLHAAIQATCEGAGCVSAESAALPAFTRIGKAMAKALTAYQAQTAK